MLVSRNLVFIALLFCALNSCNKDNNNPSGSLRLQRIQSSWGDSIGNSYYHYDTSNHIISLTGSNNNGYSGETLFEYDSSFKIVKALLSGRRPDGTISQTSYSFVYDNGKVMQKLTQYSPDEPYLLTNIYLYDEKGRLIKDSLINYQSNSFIYNNDDDIVQETTYYPRSGTSTTWTANYNSQENAYFYIGPIGYFVFGATAYLNKHNRTQSSPLPEGTTPGVNYSYIYEDGLPKKIIRQTAGSDIPSVIEFFYEPY